MRTVYDLRSAADKFDLGLALAPIVTTFVDNRVDMPLGRCWDALEQLLEEMERRAIAGVNARAQASLMARLASKMFGFPIPPVTPSAEAYAHLDGQLKALRDIRAEIPALIHAAYSHKAQPEKKSGDDDEKARQRTVAAMPVGRSRM